MTAIRPRPVEHPTADRVLRRLERVRKADADAASGPTAANTARSVLQLADYGYAVILLCALTAGPVTYVWTNRITDEPAALAAAVDWTFVLLQLPAVALASRRLQPRPDRALWALSALVGWLVLSLIWSAAPAFTAAASASLALTCCAGLYLTLSFGWRDLVAVTFVAMQPGLILSRLAIDRSWPGAGQDLIAGGIAGIYGNRNSLGPPAVFAVACGAVLIAMVVVSKLRPPWRVLLAVGTLAVVVFDLDLQRRAQSTTSWLMLVSFLGTVVVLTVANALPWSRARPAFGVVVGRVILVACTIAFLVAVILNDEVSRAFDRPPGFHDRLEYWEADLEGALNRPVLGWGWMAAWHADEFRVDLPPAIATDIWSHSAYLDVALGGGVVAVLLGIVLAVNGSRSAGAVLRRGDVSSAVPMAVVVAVAIGCTQESFFVGNYFLTALLVAGLCAALGPSAGRSGSQAER